MPQNIYWSSANSFNQIFMKQTLGKSKNIIKNRKLELIIRDAKLKYKNVYYSKINLHNFKL